MTVVVPEWSEPPDAPDGIRVDVSVRVDHWQTLGMWVAQQSDAAQAGFLDGLARAFAAFPDAHGELAQLDAVADRFSGEAGRPLKRWLDELSARLEEE